ADRVPAADFGEARHVALVHQAHVPLHGVLEALLVQVEVAPPGVLVGRLPAGAAGERRPLGLAPATAAGPVAGQPVDLDVVLAEARLVTALAVGVHGQVGDDLLERPAVG